MSKAFAIEQLDDTDRELLRQIGEHRRGKGALGLGAAWYEREHGGLGVPFPPIAERFERLEEKLQLVGADIERVDD